MLSLFPQILFLAPAGTALLRIAAGLAYLYVAYFLWSEQKALAQERLPLIGSLPPWLASIASLLFAAIGVLLIVGLWTQCAALLAALASLKGALFAKKYPRIVPLSRAAYLFLFVICLSLVVSGAGAFGFDLPL